MTEWKGIVARAFTPKEFMTYVASIRWGTWRPSFCVLHNTEIPTLDKWNLVKQATGGVEKYLRSLERYYRDDQKWSAGPHLFVDQEHICVFTRLTTTGVHSPSWNSVAWGVEMVGSYALTPPPMDLWQNTASALATLCCAMKMDPTVRIRLHKEDPRTTHDCPGKMVDKARMIALVQEKMAARGCPPGVLPGVPTS